MWKDPKDLYAEIEKLQQQLEGYLGDVRERFNYSVENGRVYFDKTVKRFHKKYKVSLPRYLFGARLSHIITAPVIYGMVVPLAFFDLTLTVYQHICFRAYGVPRVRRRDYWLIDRHKLAYLNGLEKLNCVYCSYGNGVVGYGREILSRTEQYWCPIKHALAIKLPHSRYPNFSEYGDAEGYRIQLRELRESLARENEET